MKSKKEILAQRDKGKKTYSHWYAFGRNQGFTFRQSKLFFPHIATENFSTVYCDDNDILFYNGMAALASDVNHLLYLKKIMASKIFWFYISSTSKPYGKNHYSLARNYIKNFGIPQLDQSKLNTIILKPSEEFENWLMEQYNFTSIDIEIIQKNIDQDFSSILT